MGNQPSSLDDDNQQHHHHRSHSHSSYPSSAPLQSSTTSSGHHRDNSGIRGLLRNNGALGLSKAELDVRCQPSGLYQSTNNWEYKQVRRLIGDGKLAARCKGSEERTSERDTECPICFLQYPAVNQTKCCQAYVCTECYLQVRNPKESSAACPFCNQKLSVQVANISHAVLQERRSEEQRVIEAQIRAKSSTSGSSSMTLNETTQSTSAMNSSNSLSSSKPAPPGSSLPSLSETPQNTAFGASLEQNERVAMMRKRSSGDSSSDSLTAPSSDVKALAMTPAERQALEAEMKAQHHHPLAQRIQQEEEERRFQNQRDYLNSPQYQQRQERQMRELHTARRLLAGGGSSRRTTRDWNRIVQAFESGAAGSSVQSLDDLVVLEAAIMLSSSMEPSSNTNATERAASHSAATSSSSSRRRRRHTTANTTDDDPDTAENEDDFAARHARAGFPLARARVGGHDGDALLSANATRRLPRSWMMTALMTEEEQLAMAIANSLQDAPPEAADNNNNATDSGSGGDGNTDTAAAGGSPVSVGVVEEDNNPLGGNDAGETNAAGENDNNNESTVPQVSAMGTVGSNNTEARSEAPSSASQVAEASGSEPAIDTEDILASDIGSDVPNSNSDVVAPALESPISADEAVAAAVIAPDTATNSLPTAVVPPPDTDTSVVAANTPDTTDVVEGADTNTAAI